MPDLTNKGCHKFWQQYQDKSIYKTISFMEGVEDWTLDGKKEVEEAMESLSKVLDNIGNIDLQEEESFIRISASIKTGRALRLLQSIDKAHPGAASKILMHAEENSSSENSINNLFIQRNIVFERLRLFARIFSEDRFNKVINVLKGEKTK